MIIIACILVLVIIAFLLILKVEKLLSKVFSSKEIKRLLNVRFLCGNKSAFNRFARDKLRWFKEITPN
jgi:cell division protein FtsX